MSRLSLQRGQEVRPHLLIMKSMDFSLLHKAPLDKPLEFLLVVCECGFEGHVCRVASVLLSWPSTIC